MNLMQPSEENLEFMIEEIKKKLKVASIAAIKASHFDVKYYEDIKEMYEVIADKEHFSISEMNALVEELGSFRKR